jgi:hypothetical protein
MQAWFCVCALKGYSGPELAGPQWLVDDVVEEYELFAGWRGRFRV